MRHRPQVQYGEGDARRLEGSPRDRAPTPKAPRAETGEECLPGCGRIHKMPTGLLK
ncbi:MAG: hypothetical protein AABM66_08230 [Actinomycetota bacterium]